MSNATVNDFDVTVEETGGEFELCPADNHAAVCFGIIELGTQMETYQGDVKYKGQLGILVELPNELQSNGKPHTFCLRFTKHLGEKANLRKFLQTWTGASFVVNESFKLGSIVGKAGLLNVTHVPNKKKPGKYYANAGALTPLPRGMVAPQGINAPVLYSLKNLLDGVEPPADEWLPRIYGTKVADIVKESQEWKKAHGGAAGGANLPHADDLPREPGDDTDIPF